MNIQYSLVKLMALTTLLLKLPVVVVLSMGPRGGLEDNGGACPGLTRGRSAWPCGHEGLGPLSITGVKKVQ